MHTVSIDTLIAQKRTAWVAILDIQETGMTTLAVILCVWATAATCAALFIRGASPRLERATVRVSTEHQPTHASFTE